MANGLEENVLALDAFDYIMNTERTYKALSVAVVKLTSRARSQRQSPSTELLRAHNSQCRCQREWFRDLLAVIRDARQDYRKNFGGEEPPDWMRHQSFTPCQLMAVALTYSDRLAA